MIPCPDATCDCDLQGTERLLPDLAAFATGLRQTGLLEFMADSQHSGRAIRIG